MVIGFEVKLKGTDILVTGTRETLSTEDGQHEIYTIDEVPATAALKAIRGIFATL